MNNPVNNSDASGFTLAVIGIILFIAFALIFHDQIVLAIHDTIEKNSKFNEHMLNKLTTIEQRKEIVERWTE